MHALNTPVVNGTFLWLALPNNTIFHVLGKQLQQRSQIGECQTAISSSLGIKGSRVSKQEVVGTLSSLLVYLKAVQTSWMIPVLLFKGINDRERLEGFLSRIKITLQRQVDIIGLYKYLQFQPSVYSRCLPDVYHYGKACENTGWDCNEIGSQNWVWNLLPWRA